MFSLIITIISIALVVALAVASIYYGGSAFTQGSAKSQAATIVSQAQQVAGANTLYANDNGGTFATSLSTLQTGNYLQAIPNPPASVTGAVDATYTGSWTVDANNVVTLGVTSAPVCLAIEKSIGSAASTATAVNASLSSTAQYDCAVQGTGFAFKYKG